LNVQWRLLGRFLVLALITILGIAKVLILDNTDLIEGGGALSLFWSWYNLAVLTLCCFVCLEQPRRRRDERFATKERVLVRIGGLSRSYDVKDISAGGLCLSGRISEPIGLSAAITLEVIELPAVIARKEEDELAVGILGDDAREIMTRHVYSEGIFGRPKLFSRAKFCSTSSVGSCDNHKVAAHQAIGHFTCRVRRLLHLRLL